MLITNFSSGELSNKLNGRVDLQQYYQGASKIKNFEIIPTGGIERRAGMKRIGELHGKCKLIPFIIDKDTSFILEVCNELIYIWKKDGPFITTAGLQATIPVEYDEDHLDGLQYAQNYNELTIVHKEYNPITIKYANRAFTKTEIAFDFQPNVNVDDDYDYVIIAGDEKPAVSVIDNVPYINGVAYPYGAYCIWHARLYKYFVDTRAWLPYGMDPDVDDELFTTVGKRPGSVCYFNNRLFFAGSNFEPQKVWASAAPDTQGNRYFNFATYQKYITVNKVVKDADVHIFTCNVRKTDIHDGRTILTGVTQDLTTGLKEDPTSYYLSNNNFPIGTKVISVTADTITVDKAITIDEDLEAVTCTIQLWRSLDVASSADYEYQVIESNITTSDCSFNFEIASSENDSIKWLSNNKYLSIGTESSVWEAPASINALNIQAVMNGRYGSDDIPALTIDTAVVYFAQGKRGIREHYFSNNQEAFQTNNIAIMAEHVLTESPAVDFDYCCNPYNKLIIVREDGIAVTLLYDKNNGVMAWNRIEHGNGLLRACAVTRGDKQNDLIFFAVEQEGSLFLELLDSNNEVYLDSWEEGDEESGYEYESEIVSLPVIAGDPTSKKRIVNLLVRFVDSYFPEIKVDNLPSEHFYGTPGPYSGIKNVTYPGISDRDVRFTITCSKNERVNILSINAVLA